MSHFWPVLKGIWSCAKSMAASEIFALACGYFSIATHCGSVSEGGGECGKLDGRLLLSFWWCWLCWAHDLDAALPSMPSVLNNNVTILGYLPCGLYPRKPSSFHVPHPSMYPPPPPPSTSITCLATKMPANMKIRERWNCTKWVYTLATHSGQTYLHVLRCVYSSPLCVRVCVCWSACVQGFFTCVMIEMVLAANQWCGL